MSSLLCGFFGCVCRRTFLWFFWGKLVTVRCGSFEVVWLCRFFFWRKFLLWLGYSVYRRSLWWLEVLWWPFLWWVCCRNPFCGLWFCAETFDSVGDCRTKTTISWFIVVDTSASTCLSVLTRRAALPTRGVAAGLCGVGWLLGCVEWALFLGCLEWLLDFRFGLLIIFFLGFN